MWRLLVGEAIRGEADATTCAREIVAALDVALESWLDGGFPELAGDHAARRPRHPRPGVRTGRGAPRRSAP